MNTDFISALIRSGMIQYQCKQCTRPFFSRDPLELCPPCEMGVPDGWDAAATESMRQGYQRRFLDLLVARGCRLAAHASLENAITTFAAAERRIGKVPLIQLATIAIAVSEELFERAVHQEMVAYHIETNAIQFE